MQLVKLPHIILVIIQKKSFKRRVEKVLEDHRINIDDVIVKISRNNGSFLEEIVKEIPVNTTEIFRDTKTWQTLKFDILKKYQDKETIDIWHVGCSTWAGSIFCFDFAE